MNSQPNGPCHPGPDKSGWYEFRIQGRLDDRWAVWFDDMAFETSDGGVTTLRGPVVDQAALHGILARLRDIGLPLLGVECVPDPSPPPSLDEHDTG
jgi:hypothetical protein